MQVKQGTREGGVVQMCLKCISQLVELRHGMIVAHRFSGGFPDMLLRVEIGSGWRQPEDLDPRVLLQEGLDHLTAMPSGSVPQQQDGLRGVSCQEHEQKEYSGCTIHDR